MAATFGGRFRNQQGALAPPTCRMLKAKGVTFRATEQPIDTTTAAGKCFMDMLCVFAEFEANLARCSRNSRPVDNVQNLSHFQD